MESLSTCFVRDYCYDERVMISQCSLAWIRVSGNQLGGTLPDHLGDLSNLEGVELDRNHFRGSLPSGWNRLSQLRTYMLWVSLFSCSHSHVCSL